VPARGVLGNQSVSSMPYGPSKLRDTPPAGAAGAAGDMLAPSPASYLHGVTAFGRHGRSRSPSPSPGASPSHSPRSASFLALNPASVRLKRRRTFWPARDGDDVGVQR